LGLKRANDKLPKAFTEPLPDGVSAGYLIPFDDMLDAYYSARDWDKETGIPTRNKLVTLGLNDLVKDFI
jgi:aldehyde:ferredoxin oxidoreductase